MAATHLNGAEWVPAPSGGGFFANDVPDKGLLHTTEGDSIEGAISAYRNANSWPHFTVDPARGRIVQHIGMDRSAMALYNGPQPMETNRAGTVIQIEIVARAGSTHTYTDAWYQWLATQVIRPISLNLGLPPRMTKFYGAMDGTIAVETWPGRLQDDRWNGYNGWLGHQNVGDGNDHWDPGKLNETKLLVYAFGGGEVYDPISRRSWMVGTGDVDPLPGGGFSPQPLPGSEDDELMGKADDIIAQLTDIQRYLAALSGGGQVEAYDAGGGQWRTAALVNGAATHGGVVMPLITALVFEAASYTRITKGGGTTVAAPVDVNAVADAVLNKLRAALAQ